MGGGDTERPEVAKRLRRGRDGKGSGIGGAGGRGEVDTTANAATVETPICERSQTVSVRLTTKVEAGSEVRVILGDPPAIVADRKQVVGVISDARQAATLVACIEDGYAMVGEIVAVDGDLHEGIATIVGVRSG